MDLATAIQKQINFCQYNEKYRCGIFVKNSERLKIVTEVISYLLQNPNGVIELKKSRYDTLVSFRNGSLIRVVIVSDNARGQRYNGAIIDSDIIQEIIDTVILPCLRPLELENNQYSNNDNPKDRVYYCSINKMEHKSISCNKEQLLYVPSTNDYIGFKRWYECMADKNGYSKPIIEKEEDNTKVLVYESRGIPKDMIKYETEFQTYLNIKGELNNEIYDFAHLKIDTNIYRGYEVNIKDGVIIVTLFKHQCDLGEK